MSSKVRALFCLVTLVAAAGVFSFIRKQFLSYQSTYEYSLARIDERNGGQSLIGQQFPLDQLTDQHTNLLSAKPLHNLTVIAVVDPDCPACEIAIDQIREVKNISEANGIGFNCVAFSLINEHERLVDYCTLLGTSTPAFALKPDANLTHSGFATLVVPSFLLLSRSGTIMNVFPGTDASDEVRKLMVKSMMAEVLAVDPSQIRP